MMQFFQKLIALSYREQAWWFVFGLLALLFAGLVITQSVGYNERGVQQYGYLAKSFTQSSLSFTEMPDSWEDTALFEGQRYWPLGPLPALLLVPLAALGLTTSAQGYLSGVLVLITVGLWYVLARRVGFGSLDALVTAIAFGVASPFLAVALLPTSWHLATAIAVAGVSGALIEYLGKRRWWLIGLLLSVTIASRLTAGLGAIFFVGMLFRLSPSERTFALKQLLLPLVVTIGLLALYNWLRFGDLFETGYQFQELVSLLDASRSQGLISWSHLPRNFYYIFLAPPVAVWHDVTARIMSAPYFVPGEWGMSIFVTSPYLLLLFFGRYNTAIKKALLGASVFVAIPILLFFGNGWIQFGSRYALDFLPFLFLLFLYIYKDMNGPEFSGRMRALIVVSSLFNLYLFVAPWSVG